MDIGGYLFHQKNETTDLSLSCVWERAVRPK
jgi:hypothetical protein